MLNDDTRLDEVWTGYQVALDCHRMAKKMAARGEEAFLAKTVFVEMSLDQAEQSIDHSRHELDNWVVLTLWAQFEHFLISYVREKGGLLSQTRPEAFAAKLQDKFDREVGDWKRSEILDLFKGIVETDLIGQAKQIKEYRDWVAHKSRRRQPSSRTSPKLAFEVLKAIIDKVRVVEDSLT
ncbi:MAG: hypothetical protein V1792_13795 [Pseudomonadota bacterium]